MPTYEYKCSNCNENFEVFQKMSDEPVAKCPKCGKPAKRIISAFGVNFKGSGFYKTDTTSKTNGTAKSSCSGKSCSGCSGCSS